MNKPPATDIHSLVHKEVECTMRPFIQATMIEHEHTRDVVKQNTAMLKRIAATKTHSMVNSFLIGALFIFVLVFLTAC